MVEVTIQAEPWVLETAAAILRTFNERGPSSDRPGIEAIANELAEAATRYTGVSKITLADLGG